jgi:hypothetical protein
MEVPCQAFLTEHPEIQIRCVIKGRRKLGRQRSRVSAKQLLTQQSEIISNLKQSERSIFTISGSVIVASARCLPWFWIQFNIEPSYHGTFSLLQDMWIKGSQLKHTRTPYCIRKSRVCHRRETNFGIGMLGLQSSKVYMALISFRYETDREALLADPGRSARRGVW